MRHEDARRRARVAPGLAQPLLSRSEDVCSISLREILEQPRVRGRPVFGPSPVDEAAQAVGVAVGGVQRGAGDLARSGPAVVDAPAAGLGPDDVRDAAEESLVAAREVEAVAPGYGEDEQHFLEWLVLSLLLGRGVGYRCQQEYCPPRLHALLVTCCPAPRMRSGNALPSKRLHAELPASPWPDARGRVTRALRTESPP